MIEKNMNKDFTCNDALNSEVSRMYDAKSSFRNMLSDSVAKQNLFWVPTEYDDDTGLKEIIISENDFGENYCSAYTYSNTSSEADPDYHVEDQDYGIYTMDEIYRTMVNEDIDYLTLWSTDAYMDIYITDLQDIMVDLEGKF